MWCSKSKLTGGRKKYPFRALNTEEEEGAAGVENVELQKMTTATDQESQQSIADEDPPNAPAALLIEIN